jgi:hypothetical protein
MTFFRVRSISFVKKNMPHLFEAMFPVNRPLTVGISQSNCPSDLPSIASTSHLAIDTLWTDEAPTLRPNPSSNISLLSLTFVQLCLSDRPEWIPIARVRHAWASTPARASVRLCPPPLPISDLNPLLPCLGGVV